MKLLRNVLAVIGLLTLLIVTVAVSQIWSATRHFDPDAFALYREFAGNLLETGDLASAFVWRVKVEDDIKVEDVKESMKSLAVDRNLFFVSDSPFYKQVKAVTGKDFRHVSFMQFCDVKVGVKMLDYNDASSAFMPCVISVVEDKEGKVWLYAMNMDFLIHGANELPPELKNDALRVRRVLREIMEGAAAGEF
ncbi:MAG: DUF302 domain-containing protein [Chromatiales bacterium]|nr:DUF302 domain-containing protein [Gammaproteobacteria bacterium]